ncbi:nuclear factor of activated T-cells, cytoplasmic 2-like [Brachionichthys hirsutus]|uniref:nuclear factor of activated T-cells, cytoplasmic 2-like n=1 Tax=Brachionichthys hirsutus TaxID=412623 RepID=UPI0036044E0A
MTSGDVGLTEGLCQDSSQEELDFSDLLLYHSPAGGFHDEGDASALSHSDGRPPLPVVEHPAAWTSSSSQPASAQDLSYHRPTSGYLPGPDSEPSSRPGIIPAPSPRIEITPWDGSFSPQTLELNLATNSQGPWRECASPASSNSSTGWPAEACSPAVSPCISPSIEGCGVVLSGLDLCPGLQGAYTSSPGASPRNSVTDETFLVPQHQHTTSSIPHQRSRSASPHGKRSYEQTHSCQGGTPIKQRSRSTSPIPAPHEQQGSYYLHQYQDPTEIQHRAQAPSPSMEQVLSTLSSSLPKVLPSALMHNARGCTKSKACVYGEEYNWPVEQERMDRAGAEVKPETFYMLQTVLPPPHSVSQGAFCALPVAPLPPLEWQLPRQSGRYELIIKEQPRPHHRAHYETEGSRGAVKTSKGGHPEVQLRGYQGVAPLGLQVFIGTADERLLKPHAFYQVHRITGKTVATASMERMMHGTKVLEIPLEPKNLMRVVIDCVGILKLRNADIEMRNGETDIGRKNTRVRLVFRVHVPHPGGQLVSLQVASDPIECSQRSAQELPAVETQSLDRCAVLGGQQLVITGQHFTSDSKVIFSEKTQDGQQIWEVEATLDKDKTQASMLCVEVPPYRDWNICHPAKVNFYVVNGKKKRSQPQHFTYTPPTAIKAEPLDDCQLTSPGYSESQSLTDLPKMSLNHHLELDGNCQALNISPTLYHLNTVDPRACLVTPDPLNDHPVCYRSTTGTLTNSSMFCYSGNQHYSNRGATLFCSSPMATHLVSTPSQCDSARAPVAKLVEGPDVGGSFEDCMMSKLQSLEQKALLLRKSPPIRSIPGQAQGKAGIQVEQASQCPSQIEASSRNHDGAPAKVTVKEESLHYSYLEDVNDIIRRDLRGQNAE